MNDQAAIDSLCNALQTLYPVRLTLSLTLGGYLEISSIIVERGQRNQGIGTSVMRAIIGFANLHRLPCALTPAGDFGGNVRRLRLFYKRFGFKGNGGCNRTFDTWCSMVRPALSEDEGLEFVIDTEYDNIEPCGHCFGV